MESLARLNAAMDYIEKNLCNEIDMQILSQIALYTPSGLRRFFSYATGMSIAEYIRRRRLSLAALALYRPGTRVLDIALQYGYKNADSFYRAFKRQHGISPGQVRLPGAALKLYPPISFHFTVKGVEKMEFKMVQMKETVLYGRTETLPGPAQARFEQECALWMSPSLCTSISETTDGVWYGVYSHGDYSIARAKADVRPGAQLTQIVLPAGQYAVFTSERGKAAGDVLPALREQAFRAGFPAAKQHMKEGYEIEVYHLCPYCNKKERYYELWFPIKP